MALNGRLILSPWKQRHKLPTTFILSFCPERKIDCCSQFPVFIPAFVNGRWRLAQLPHVYGTNRNEVEAQRFEMKLVYHRISENESYGRPAMLCNKTSQETFTYLLQPSPHHWYPSTSRCPDVEQVDPASKS